MLDPKIKEAFSKIKIDIEFINNKLNLLREQVRELTPRTTPPNTPRTSLKSIEKKVMNKLNTAQLMKSIKHYIDEGYKTNEIRDEIMLRFGIKKTCFFKHLKQVRGLLREPTPRT